MTVAEDKQAVSDMAAGSRHSSNGRGFVVQCARVFIALVCLSALATVANHGLDVTAAELSRKSVSSGTFVNTQQECIYHQIHSQLPKGATVYISGTGYNEQRLVELTALWAVPQASPSRAKWTISIVPGKTCSGESLQIQRVVPPPFLTRVLRPANGAAAIGHCGACGRSNGIHARHPSRFPPNEQYAAVQADRHRSFVVLRMGSKVDHYRCGQW